MKLSVRKTRGGIFICAPIFCGLALYRADFWGLAFQNYDTPRAKYLPLEAVCLAGILVLMMSVGVYLVFSRDKK